MVLNAAIEFPPIHWTALNFTVPQIPFGHFTPPGE
jgi:hypothetical protein